MVNNTPFEGVSARNLVDKKHQWRKHKLESLAVADAYSFFDVLRRYSQRIQDCGSYLHFSSCPHGHERRLLRAGFCRCRLCIMCQWRKSLVMFHQVLRLIHEHKKHYKSDIPLFLTLTVPSVSANDLNECLDNIQKSFKKLMKRRVVKRSVRSWFRGLEVNYNSEKKTYNPHFHVLLLVPDSYFRKDRGLYIDQQEWLQMWREVTEDFSISQVDIRRVKKKTKRKSLETIAAEVSKYVVKPKSIVNRLEIGSFSANPEVIKTLHYALKGRRLSGLGGLFFKLRKDLKIQDVEAANLIHIEDDTQGCKCSVCQSDLIEEMYRWHLGLRQYISK